MINQIRRPLLFLAFVITVVYSIVSLADATDSTTTPPTPQVKAHFSLNNTNFDHVIEVTFTPAVDMNQLRQQALDTSLMKQLTTWVVDDSYKQVEGDDQFWLTIGKSGHNFTHMFHCKEAADDSNWAIDCNEDAQVPSGEKAVTDATRSIRCVNSAGTDLVPSKSTCTFEMTGASPGLTIMGLIHVSTPEISYILFQETVNYVIGYSFIASGMSTDAADAKRRASGSAYASLVRGVASHVAEVKKSTAESIKYDFASENGEAILSQR